jgi:hypothetical protein
VTSPPRHCERLPRHCERSEATQNWTKKRPKHWMVHRTGDHRKKFFVEKKNQKKSSAPLRAVLKQPGSKTNKVFLLLFVHKKKFFLFLPSIVQANPQ